jgi:hypothetical protein
MKSLFALTVLCCSLLAAAQTPTTLLRDHSLASGGTVVLTMNVGDVKILPASQPGHVRLEIHSNRTAGEQTMAGWIQRFEVAANRATVEIQIPKSVNEDCNDCGVEVTLYVPPQSDLEASLHVGDMTVRGVEGNKNLDVGVGDLHIAVADPADYGHVQTHTRIGDIDDFLNHSSGQSGFLGQTEDFTLAGRYHLKASAGVGDVKIFQGGNS